MAWTCERVEERLGEYVDRLLSPEESGGFDAHAGDCPRCRRLVAQVSGTVAAMRGLEPVEEPPQLVYAVLDRTLGPRARREKKGWLGWLAWLRPVLQPRVAMGAATVLVTASIVFPALGIRPTKLTAEDLKPANLYREADRRAHLVYARGVKFVNDLRVVYEIQSRLQPEQTPPPAPEREAPPKKESPQSQKPGRQMNRAKESSSLSLLASVLVSVPQRSMR